MFRINYDSAIIKIAVLGFILAIIAPSLLVKAADLTSASLELSDPRPTEAGVTYTFSASDYTASTIRCVELSLNDAADGSGSIPAGITTTGSSLAAATDVITDGSWTVDNSTNGILGATFAAGESPAASGDIVWSGVTNGNTEDTYFGIFRTYANVDCSTGGPLDTVTVAYVQNDGELVELTIEPTLTLTCVGVGSGQGVNGATTNTATSCAGIDYGTTVTSAVKGVSAHDMQVTTNAPGGYSLYIRHTGLLENAATDTIDNHTGTNLAPTVFPAAGTEAWGYTTNDATILSGTTDRFTSAGGNKWSGFNTSNEVVGDLATATPSTQTTRVGQQVGIAASSEAGTYQTTIIYTLVATF